MSELPHADTSTLVPPVTAHKVDLRTVFNPPEHGAVDHFIRRFGALSHLLAILAVYGLIAVAVGLAMAPALWFLSSWYAWSTEWSNGLRWPVLGAGVGLAFFITGFALLMVVPALNLILPTRVRPFKGGYFSVASIPWCLHNGLFYIVRYTFLPFVTLTPFGLWFLRAMGMKIGRRVFINTEFISDPQLITIDDDAIVGGSVHLFAHYGGGGHLTVAPVRIGARATIGQMATLMGDVEIGADAKILPHSVVLPGSRVGPGETWGGVPARPIEHSD
jgi:acetyltransferase-like isoleucine patch superfamily enzyme